MNQPEALEFIQNYFNELFVRRNLAALDEFLDPAYFDDDIGDPTVDHIQNSKDYLAARFQEQPTIGVNVIDVLVHDDVISAYLQWYDLVDGHQRIYRKGVAIFVMNGRRIVKRHTFIYS